MQVSYALRMSFPSVRAAADTARDTLNCGVTVGRCLTIAHITLLIIISKYHIVIIIIIVIILFYHHIIILSYYLIIVRSCYQLIAAIYIPSDITDLHSQINS